MCCLYTSCGRCISVPSRAPDEPGGPGPWRMGHGGGARPRASPASPQPQLLPIPTLPKCASTVVVAWQLVTPARHQSMHAERGGSLDSTSLTPWCTTTMGRCLSTWNVFRPPPAAGLGATPLAQPPRHRQVA